MIDERPFRMLARSRSLSSVNHLEGSSLIRVIIEDGSARLRSVRTMHSSSLDDNDGEDKLARRREFGGGVVGTSKHDLWPLPNNTKTRPGIIADDLCFFMRCVPDGMAITTWTRSFSFSSAQLDTTWKRRA
jgi:hypothetical protein